MKDLALLIVRLTIGTLMAGHGAQKLFGWFSGPGLKGTSGFVEQIGVKPGSVWGPAVAVGETSGGVLTALGLLHPMGPQNIASAMVVATRRVHWKLPVWVSAGGAELAVTNLAIALFLLASGPGKYSLDRALGIRLPKWFVALTWVNHLTVTGLALFRPEVAQMALDSVSTRIAYAPSTDSTATDSSLQVETRPRVADPVPETV